MHVSLRLIHQLKQFRSPEILPVIVAKRYMKEALLANVGGNLVHSNRSIY